MGSSVSKASGFSSVHNLTVGEFEPALGSLLSALGLLQILSSPLSLPLTCSRSLSLSLTQINTHLKKKKKNDQRERKNSIAHFVFSYPDDHEVLSLFNQKLSSLLQTSI